MAGWLSLTEARARWRDAPADDATLTELLDAARRQIVAYAPALSTEDGTTSAGPATVARRNRFTNPRYAASTGWAHFAGTGGGATASSVASPEPEVPASNARRLTWTTTPTVIGGGSYFGTSAAVSPATPGESLVLSAYVRPSVAQRMRLQAEWKQAGGSGNGTNAGASVDCPAGVWTRLTAGPFVAPAGTAFVVGSAYAVTGGVLWPVGSYVDMTAAMLEPALAIGAYFDGYTAPVTIDGRLYSYAWEGTLDASSSVQTYQPSIFTPNVPDGYRTAQWMQARNIANAGRVAGGSGTDLDGSSYGTALYPLDWTVKQLLRPQQAIGAIV